MGGHFTKLILLNYFLLIYYMSTGAPFTFSNEIVNLFLNLSQENAVSKLFHRVLVRKKIHSILIHEEHHRGEILAGLRKINDLKVIDLDNDLSCIIPAAEQRNLLELRQNDNYQFKIIFYPIAKRFYNTMIKYFGQKAKKFIFVTNDYDLLQFLGLVKQEKIIHAVSNKVVIEQMSKNKTLYVDVMQDTIKDVINDFKAILKV